MLPRLTIPRTLALLVLLLPPGTSRLAAAQELESATARLEPGSGTALYQASIAFGVPPKAEPVPGAPYSAEQISETIQRSSPQSPQGPADLSRIFRDSDGRVRVERTLFVGPNVERPRIVEISDPLADCHYTLDPSKKVAHRFCRLAGEERGTTNRRSVAERQRAPGEPDGLMPESLEPRLIEGLRAQGTRYAAARPAPGGGIASSETWVSPELKVNLLTRIMDAAGNEQVTRLSRIQRAEPAPVLFRIPPDYTVREEAGEFRIAFALKSVRSPN